MSPREFFLFLWNRDQYWSALSLCGNGILGTYVFIWLLNLTFSFFSPNAPSLLLCFGLPLQVWFLLLSLCSAHLSYCYTYCGADGLNPSVETNGKTLRFLQGKFAIHDWERSIALRKKLFIPILFAHSPLFVSSFCWNFPCCFVYSVVTRHGDRTPANTLPPTATPPVSWYWVALPHILHRLIVLPIYN